MLDELLREAHNFNMVSANWHNPRPDRCPCRGTGWMISDMDATYRCGIHAYKDQPHPEDDPGEYLDPDDHAAWSAEQEKQRLEHFRGLYRDALRLIRGQKRGDPKILLKVIHDARLTGDPVACLNEAYRYLEYLEAGDYLDFSDGGYEDLREDDYPGER